jgi:rhamnulokinase
MARKTCSMAGPRNYIAVDLGAESGRVVLGTIGPDGRIALREIARFQNVPVETRDGLFWDVNRILRHVEEGIKVCLASCGKIDGIGVDSWGVDFGLLDENGRLLANPRHYRDPAHPEAMKQVLEIIPAEVLYRRTGIQFLPFNTLFQLYGLSQRQPGLVRSAHRLLMIPDLVNHHLAGSQSCEYTIASTSQMLDPRARAWETDLLGLLGLPAGILPDIVEPGTILGEYKGVPVIATCCHDTASAVAGTPMESPSALYISCGTWALVGVEVPEPVINGLTLRHNFTNEGGYGSIRLLRNVTGLWLVQQLRAEWEAGGRAYSYDELTELAEGAEPFRSVIDPDSPEFLEAGPMMPRIVEFCRRTSQSAPESPGEFVRASLEGVALRVRWSAERLQEILGRRLETAHIVGGGSRNGLLCQLISDALAMRVVAGPDEATSVGNILVQGIATGAYSSVAAGRHAARESLDLAILGPAAALDTEYRRFSDLIAL